MLNIYIIAGAKIKNDSPIFDLIKVYLHRITLYNVHIKEVEVKNLSTYAINEKIFNLIPKDSYRIMLDEKGVEYSTLQLKSCLENITKQNIAFLIGGSDGFLPEYKNQVESMISLSRLTFPHQIARMLLVEQLYRVQCLQQNHPYHRE